MLLILVLLLALLLASLRLNAAMIWNDVAQFLIDEICLRVKRVVCEKCAPNHQQNHSRRLEGVYIKGRCLTKRSPITPHYATEK